MGHNFGSIHIKKKSRITQDKVCAAIEDYLLAQGGRRSDRGMFAIEPMCIDDGGDQLALAVSPWTDGWMAIADSERYTASRALARHLSAVLKAEVLWFEICDAANEAAYQVFNAGLEAPKHDDEEASNYSATCDYLDALRLPWFGLYFDQRTKQEWQADGFRLLGFREVTGEAYFGEPPSDEDEPSESADAEQQVASTGQADEQAQIIERGWAIWRQLTAGDPDILNLDSDFRDATTETIYPTLDWYGELKDFVSVLCRARAYEQALEIAEFILRTALRPSTARWRGVRADALLGLGRWQDAEDDLRFVLFAEAHLRDTYLRYARYLELTGRRDDAVRLTAAIAGADAKLYTCNSDLWSSTELEKAAKSHKLKQAGAISTLARFLADELEGRYATIEHTTRNLNDFLGLWERLEKPEQLAPLASAAGAELARREKSLAAVHRATRQGDLASLRAGLSDLPHQSEAASQLAREIAPRVPDDELRCELLAYAVEEGELHVLADLFQVMRRLGRHDAASSLLTQARWQARRDSRLYHHAACVAARHDRNLALQLAAMAKKNHCPSFPLMRNDPELASLHREREFQGLFDDLGVLPVRACADDHWPHTRRELLVRDNFFAAFLIPGEFAQLAGDIAGMVDAFLDLIPSDGLGWGMIGANACHADDLKPFDEKLLARARQHLDPSKAASKKAHVFFELFGPEQDNPGYYLAVSGNNRGDNLALVEMRFPVEFVASKGVVAFRKWLETVSTLVPYTYGFASLALSPHSFYSSDHTMLQRLAALALWYTGFDIVHLLNYQVHLGDKVPGAKWLTFLDGGKVERLGGIGRMRRKVASGVQIEALANGVVVRAGDEPDRGDHESFKNAVLMRSVHEMLEPIRKTGWNPNGCLDLYPGGHEAWEKRYLA